MSNEYVNEVPMLSEVEMPVSGMESPTENVNDHPDIEGTARRRCRLSTRGEASAKEAGKHSLSERSTRHGFFKIRTLKKADVQQWVSLTATISGAGRNSQSNPFALTVQKYKLQLHVLIRK